MDETKIRPLTLEEVKAFLAAKTKGDECFSCGENAWVFTGYGDGNVFNALPYAHTSTLDNNTVSINTAVAKPILTMFCANCGFIRQHDLYPVMTWIEEQSKGSKDNG